MARGAADRALEAARAVRARREDRASYLSLREAIAAGAPFWARRAQTGAGPLLGPRRSVDEAGGALARLDAALASSDEASAERELVQVERALSLIREEIAANGVPLDVAASVLSGAAYDLGLAALEALPSVPEGDDAVLADVRGALAGLASGARAIAEIAGDARAEACAAALSEVRASLAPLEASAQRDRLTDRGAFARGTGALGVAVRRLASAAGASPRAPYPPRVASGADEPVSALTLPGPRRAAAGAAAPDDATLAELGRKLFFDPRLSRGDRRSCASCHQPARGFADGLARPIALEPERDPRSRPRRDPRSLEPKRDPRSRSLEPKRDPRSRSLERLGAGGAGAASGPASAEAPALLRHTPTLLYTSVHAAQMWDGRTLTAEAQALGVIHAKAEMGLAPGELAEKLGRVPEYRDALAGPDGAVAPAAVARALVAFEVRELSPADAPIDRFARGDDAALSADERAGLDVFAGKGRCARCHVPPLFGGSRPRDFAVPVYAVLGVPADPSGRALDADRGRAAVTRRAADERSFKTPTVRNVDRTAPYFHHGAFARLEDVVAFYDKGGGRGLGLDVPNQDPDVRKLGLTPDETRVLLLFMRRSLSDATDPARLGRR